MKACCWKLENRQYETLPDGTLVVRESRKKLLYHWRCAGCEAVYSTEQRPKDGAYTPLVQAQRRLATRVRP
jgi:hypothetical protein